MTHFMNYRGTSCLYTKSSYDKIFSDIKIIAEQLSYICNQNTRSHPIPNNEPNADNSIEINNHYIAIAIAEIKHIPNSVIYT